MDLVDPVPRRRTCGLCAQQGHDRRHCRAADLYMAAHPDLNQGLRALYRTEIVAFAAAGLPPIPPPIPRTRCITNQNHAHWGDRFQCRAMAPPGQQFCTRCEAVRPRPDLPPTQQCIRAGCERIRSTRGFCEHHARQDLTRQRTRHIADQWNLAVIQMDTDPTRWNEIVAGWDAHQPPELLGQRWWWATQARQLRVRLAGHYFIRELWNETHPHDPMDENGVIDWHWNRMRRHEEQDPAPAAGTLRAFVRDGQNVHTRVVSDQTTAGLAKLLAAPRLDNMSENTKRFIAKLLEASVRGKKLRENQSAAIHRDFNHWYATETCRNVSDHLYRRTMDGLLMTIREVGSSAARTELYLRLVEEMQDSVGMCCDGHITRLVNVMAGFDDAFVPEKSVGEKVQELFAALAAKECSLLEKVAEGVQNLRKWGVPEDEWEPWIDAL